MTTNTVKVTAEGFTVSFKGSEVTFNKIEKIKIGNSSDNAGSYRGNKVDCEILRIEFNMFFISVLARVVEDPNYIVQAIYSHEHLSSTNARVIGQFGFKTLEDCAQSLGFSNKEGENELYTIEFENGETIVEYGTSQEDIRQFAERVYKHTKVKSITLPS